MLIQSWGAAVVAKQNLDIRTYRALLGHDRSEPEEKKRRSPSKSETPLLTGKGETKEDAIQP